MPFLLIQPKRLYDVDELALAYAIVDRWLGLPPEDGARFILDTTSISVLGYEHDLTEPVIRRWNQK